MVPLITAHQFLKCMGMGGGKQVVWAWGPCGSGFDYFFSLSSTLHTWDGSKQIALMLTYQIWRWDEVVSVDLNL